MFNPKSLDSNLTIKRITIARGCFRGFYHWVMTAPWWHAYTATDIVFARRFIDRVTFQPDESAVIDYTRIHFYERSPKPASIVAVVRGGTDTNEFTTRW